jgi:hypothetical protein
MAETLICMLQMQAFIMTMREFAVCPGQPSVQVSRIRRGFSNSIVYSPTIADVVFNKALHRTFRPSLLKSSHPLHCLIFDFLSLAFIELFLQFEDSLPLLCPYASRPAAPLPSPLQHPVPIPRARHHPLSVRPTSRSLLILRCAVPILAPAVSGGAQKAARGS